MKSPRHLRDLGTTEGYEPRPNARPPPHHSGGPPALKHTSGAQHGEPPQLGEVTVQDAVVGVGGSEVGLLLLFVPVGVGVVPGGIHDQHPPEHTYDPEAAGAVAQSGAHAPY